MPEYVARAVTVLDFSDPKSIKVPQIFQVQLCVINFKKGLIDIGSNCYIDSEVNKNGAPKVVKNSQGISVCRVSLESFDRDRVALLQQLVGYAAHSAISISQITLEGRVKYVLAFFRFYWLQVDLNYSLPENQAHYTEAARRYFANLNANQKLSATYKYQRSHFVFAFAGFLYGEDNVNIFDYDIIKHTGESSRGTVPLLPEKLALALSLRSAIFDGVVDLLINNKMFPYPLTVPAECNELNNTIWLGYAPWAGSKIFPRAKEFERLKPKEWFDRGKGEFLTKEQWLDLAGQSSVKQASGQLLFSKKTLNLKNSDHSRTREKYAVLASFCFFDLLLSMTGMNQQPALDLPWYGGYFIKKGRQGTKTILLVSSEDQSELECEKETSVYLRSIKNRKGYQPVEVIINNRLLPKFKKYLQLREYYLNGARDGRLFPFTDMKINRTRISLHKVFPEIPKMGAKQARACTSDYILSEENDPGVAALVLQNEISTVIKSYAAGTQKAHIKGMGGFFNSLGQQIRLTRNATYSSMETAVGSCDQGGTSPAPLPDTPFDIDCSQQEGCFFCKHYSVHADEIDICKLVSVLYYLNKNATRASDVNYFNDLFGMVIERVNGLLTEIEKISPKNKRLVSQIKEDVFVNEKLDEYWLYKLKRLEVLSGDC